MQVEESRETRLNERAAVMPARPARAEGEPARPVPALAPSPAVAPRRRPWLIFLLLLLVVALAAGAFLLLTAGRESTDDAQVAADVVPVSTRVSGVLQHLAIHENQSVKAGDLIAQIDP